MRRFRIRLTVRRLMLVVAAVAVILFLFEEFRDGLPPRFIVRGIPARTARLRPGMTHKEVYAILGVVRSWLRGGIGSTYRGGHGFGYIMSEHHEVRPPKLIEIRTNHGLEKISQPSGGIGLMFHAGPGWEGPFGSRDRLELMSASFSVDGRTVAEMPKSP